MNLYLCMIGCEKHHDHKDFIKFLRKGMGLKKPQAEGEENKDEAADNDLALKAVCKKRNSNFAFLEFKDEDQKKAFSDAFTFTIMPQNRKYRLRDVSKHMSQKELSSFKPVKGKEQMLVESEAKKNAYVIT